MFTYAPVEDMTLGHAAVKGVRREQNMLGILFYGKIPPLVRSFKGSKFDNILKHSIRVFPQLCL